MTQVHELTLTLPLPPSPNDWATHPMERARQKNSYRRQAWGHAISQRKPWREPPESVVITAVFHVWNNRDEDNLTGGLKWVLDALRQKQTGKMRWRQGIADQCGYFVDDDPDHLHIASVEQVVDRKNQGLDLTIRWRADEEAA